MNRQASKQTSNKSKVLEGVMADVRALDEGSLFGDPSYERAIPII